MQPDPEPNASMAGFEPRFTDLTDYILRITREIWEGRDIACLRRYYAPDVIVRTPRGISRDCDTVIANTMATLAEFPDRALLGEDVIWSGTPETGMLSSHRLLCTMTHLAHGYYGPATGKQITFRVIADCHARNNMIDDEWLIRDDAAVVRQLGFTAKGFARDVLARPGGAQTASAPFKSEMDVVGPYRGTGNDDTWGACYSDLISRIMQVDFAVIARHYDRAVQGEYPGGEATYGHDPAERFWIGLRASFPDAEFVIHHTIGRNDPLMPPRAALRWSLTGKHAGWGRYGAPSGADVTIMGICHAEFGPFPGTVDGLRGQPTVRREWVAVDDVSVWKTILMHTGQFDDDQGSV